MYIRSTHKLRESEKHELLIIHLWIKEGVHSVIWSLSHAHLPLTCDKEPKSKLVTMMLIYYFYYPSINTST